MDLNLQFAEQNLQANLVRNVLICLLVAFTFYNSIKLPKNISKIITIIIIIFALVLLIINIYLTFKINDNVKTYHEELVSYASIFLIFIVIISIIAVYISE